MPSQYKLGTSAGVDLPLPSLSNPNDPKSAHNVCLVRRLDPVALMSAGILDELDSLTAIVNLDHIVPRQGTRSAEVRAAVNSRKSKKSAQSTGMDPEEADGLEFMRAFLKNKGDFRKVLALIDKVVELAVIEPATARPVRRDELGAPILDKDGQEIPLPASERRSDLVYTDNVDLDDKVAILQYVMSGVKSLESFRG